MSTIAHDSPPALAIGLLISGLALMAVAVSGCSIYFDSDDQICTSRLVAGDLYRDPVGGDCISWYPGTGSSSGSSGIGPCDTYGGGNSGAEAAPQEPPPDWGLCYIGCEGLDQAACASSPDCRMIYTFQGEPLTDLGAEGFAACWSIAPSGPTTGPCADLDAHSCSQNPSCAAVHTLNTDGTIGVFSYCRTESGSPPITCYEDSDCPADMRCDADGLGPNCGGGSTDADWACLGACVPTTPDPGVCDGVVLCDALPPDCPAGTAPGIDDGCWSGYCIPFDHCQPPLDPGSCFETALCYALPPTCPDGSVPGVADHCFTGFCIPVDQCEFVPCEEITLESGCIQRAECTPYYEGESCSCIDDLCTCESWGYIGCTSHVDTVDNGQTPVP